MRKELFFPDFRTIAVAVAATSLLLTACSARRHQTGSIPLMAASGSVPPGRELREIPEDSALESAEYFRFQRMPHGETEFPWDRYEVARSKIDAMRKFSIAQGRE